MTLLTLVVVDSLVLLGQQVKVVSQIWAHHLNKLARAHAILDHFFNPGQLLLVLQSDAHQVSLAEWSLKHMHLVSKSR